MSRVGLGVVTLAAVLAPVAAHAHLELLEPTVRYPRVGGQHDLKVGPCGRAGGERTDRVSVFAPGETITVRWDEYIGHPGHYRIAFDEDGDDDFVDPATADETYSNDAVLLDGIEDKSGDPLYEVQVTLPAVECDRCTLQVIQVMTDKLGNGWGNDDIYYQCADLVLEVSGDPGDGDTGGSGGDGGGDGGDGGDGGPGDGGGSDDGAGGSGTTGGDSGSAGDDGGGDDDASGDGSAGSDGCGCMAAGGTPVVPGALWLLALVALNRGWGRGRSRLTEGASRLSAAC